ncbi:MAG: carbohydrate kinase [Anaerolineae bacterium]|nr:carbohydrate kinase [Anaerolineales bacterium]MCQ3979999.1 carbohydrate kinase [Anaerolineae bacterium]
MNAARLDQLLQKFCSLHILVVGDFFLDKYLSLDPALSEISLETGLEAYQVVEIRHSPGAAGTVVSNLRALEVAVSVVGVIGQDGEGFDLKQGLAQRGVNLIGLLETAERFTPTYTKPMLRSTAPGGSERELNRLDIKNRSPLSTELETAVIAQLERLVPQVDGVIIADQVQERNCGVITDGVRAALVQLAQQYPAKIFAADSRVRIGEFTGVIVKPNLYEARAALEGWKVGRLEEEEMAIAAACGQALFEQNQKPIFITLGERGILVVTEAGAAHVPGILVSGEIDVVGAGDSVMAGLVASLCAGSTTEEAAFIGNMAASITIQQLGTTGTASREQLQQRMKMVDGG